MNNGWIKIHRKILDSELWLMKPCSWKTIWIYILGNVNHEPKAGFGRGEGFFNFSIEKDLIGPDITSDMIKKFLQYGRRTQMIDTSRSTRGMRIKVLNYNIYQSDDREESTPQSTREAREKHERSTPVNKNVRMKEVKKGIQSVGFDLFWELYPKKVEKKKAEEKWKRFSPQVQQLILDDLPKRKLGVKWSKEGGRYIENPLTYLNGERWNDQIESPIEISRPTSITL